MTRKIEGTEARIAVIETKLDALIKSNQEQSAKLDMLIANYVHRNEYEKDIERLRMETEEKIDKLQLEIEKTKARNTVQIWLTSTFAALFGVIMTILVQKYFQG